MRRNLQSRGSCDLHWFKMRGEVAQERGFVGEAHPGDSLSILPNFEDHLDCIVDMALRVDAAWNGKANQIHFRGAGEHQGADFYTANSSFQIEFTGQGDT